MRAAASIRQPVGASSVCGTQSAFSIGGKLNRGRLR